MTRPTWSDYFIALAKQVATRSTCNRAHVGCVVVAADHSILVTGYNGAPAGEPHCPPDESLNPDYRCPRSIHAEINADAYARKRGLDLTGSTWYVHCAVFVKDWPWMHTGPCPKCAPTVNAWKPERVVDITEMLQARIVV